jgi:hypothetical protein
VGEWGGEVGKGEDLGLLLMRRSGNAPFPPFPDCGEGWERNCVRTSQFVG